jgi:hypothetical protein
LRSIARRYALAAAAMVLLVTVVGVIMHQMQRGPTGGTLEFMAAQLQVGMTQDEAIRRILTCDRSNIDAVYVNGTKTDHTRFAGLGFRSLEEFPPADRVKQAVIEVNDEKGREFVLRFSNGVVESIRLNQS